MSWPDDIPLSAELAQFVCSLESSGINGAISWQGGKWSVRLADPQAGVFADGTFKALDEALEYMRQRALDRYRSSAFAEDYGRASE